MPKVLGVLSMEPLAVWVLKSMYCGVCAKMCIIDSVRGAAADERERVPGNCSVLHFAFDDESDTFELIEIFTPVSYTHLDVYKRQDFYNAAERHERFHPSWIC